MNIKYLRSLLYQILICIPIALAIGLVVSFFLWSLDWVTEIHFAHPILLYFLPLGGIIIHLLYKDIGKSSERGNNLVLDEIHQFKKGIPWIMSPLILFTTLITHLLGGSAGREGTAVQIGASMASTIGTWFKLDTINFRVILIAGMAGGFGAVFGTPFAGAIFAIEVLVIGKLEYKSFIPALFSSLLANQVVMLLGIHHSHYTLIPPSSLEIQTYFPYFPIHFSLVFKIILASLAFGLSSRLFSTLIYSIKNTALKFLKPLWIIPILGGILIISLSLILGTSDYLGLGVHPEFPNSLTISSAFGTNPINPLSWFWKTIFTALTLGTGFKGGEVTPLFYIGACLGNTLATWFHAPWSLFAALGFIGVFSGATKTPLASAFLGIELFGPNYALYFIITCMIASYFSGKSGIYSAQKRISDFR